MKFKPNKRGIGVFLKSRKMQGLVGAIGSGVKNEAGPGFDVQVNVGTRARATVMAKTDEARERQARDHVLERVVGQGL